MVLCHDGAHALLDGGEILGGELAGKLEIVIEALLNWGADGDLSLTRVEEFSHRLSHDVRGGMTHFIQKRFFVGLSLFFSHALLLKTETPTSGASVLTHTVPTQDEGRWLSFGVRKRTPH